MCVLGACYSRYIQKQRLLDGLLDYAALFQQRKKLIRFILFQDEEKLQHNDFIFSFMYI